MSKVIYAGVVFENLTPNREKYLTSLGGKLVKEPRKKTPKSKEVAVVEQPETFVEGE